jgi:apoptosis-inducing factor 2
MILQIEQWAMDGVTMTDQTGRPTVVIVGGGYGGIQAAKGLDEIANVVVVEPKDSFMHNVAALRALVDPTWLPRIFLPYGGLLTHGRVVRDKAIKVEPNRVVLSSGEEIAADYIVLATGSSYPFPAKTDHVDTHRAKKQILETHDALAQAGRVLLVGAGPVGIELAGEIKETWPEKSITLLDTAGVIMGGPFKSELREELQRQLDQLGVEVLLDSALQSEPPNEPGQLGAFTVTIDGGRSLTADIWFRCYGVTPNSEYLGTSLLSARRADGQIEVAPTLQVVGQTTVFAIGDLSTADAKMAAFAGRQATTVVANIKALASGDQELSDYEPMGTVILVTIGTTGGAGQLPGQDDIAGPDVASAVKGQTLALDRYAELFGLATAAND